MTANFMHPADMLQKKVDMMWAILVAFGAALIVAIMPDIAAAGTGSGNAIEKALCNVQGLMTSGTGKAIATIAVIIVGVGALMGKISWGMAFIVAVGIALVFGATSIVNAVSGASGSTTCTSGSIVTPTR